MVVVAVILFTRMILCHKFVDKKLASFSCSSLASLPVRHLLAVRDKITLTRLDKNVQVMNFIFCNFSNALLRNFPQVQVHFWPLFSYVLNQDK
jgi:hypothetical protein